MAQSSLINRSNLRDLIIILSIISSFFCDVNTFSLALGIFMLLFGCFLHFVTKGVLIRNSVLCSTGVYSIIRHPYYLANYLIDNSLCLISGNYYLLLIYPFLFFWAYGLTLKKEEILLSSIYNDSYFKYSVDIPQVFPDPKSVKNFRNIFEGFSLKRVTFKECARIIRFWSMFMLIILIHHLKDKFVFSTAIYKEMEGIDQFFAIMLIVLYILSIVLLKKKKNKRTSPTVS